MNKCSAWREGDHEFPYAYDRCYAAKECEPCECLGNEAFCDFYPERRKAATETKPEGWISVEKGMPDDGLRVLSVQTDGVVRINMASGGEFGWICNKNHEWVKTTHWMLLPEPPNKS